jgi:hypothetical protein
MQPTRLTRQVCCVFAECDRLNVSVNRVETHLSVHEFGICCQVVAKRALQNNLTPHQHNCQEHRVDSVIYFRITSELYARICRLGMETSGATNQIELLAEFMALWNLDCHDAHVINHVLHLHTRWLGQSNRTLCSMNNACSVPLLLRQRALHLAWRLAPIIIIA